VMGWLRAVPPGASAEAQEELRPTPEEGEDSTAAPHKHTGAMEYQRSDTRRNRKLQTRRRSVSPTKKPTEYRSIFLSEAGVFIDCEFACPASAPKLDALAVAPELQLLVDRIAQDYCEECRDSARKGHGEGDWRTSASVTVMNKLRRYECFASVLNINGSDLSPMVVEPKGAAAPPDQPSSFPSSAGVVCNPPFEQPTHCEPPDSDTLSYTSGCTSHSDPDALSTPKPDICVGLEHRSFSPAQQSTLNYLETDPHAQTMGLHFPFLIFEAKGNAGLFGAQNQAAVGAACMLRILGLVRCGDMVVWSTTTEGPIHELWIHYRDAEGKYQSVNVGVWRVTDMEGAMAFVGAMARILLWGSTVYVRRIVQALNAVRSE
jgi:hypothetical protein